MYQRFLKKMNGIIYNIMFYFIFLFFVVFFFNMDFLYILMCNYVIVRELTNNIKQKKQHMLNTTYIKNKKKHFFS